MVQRGLQMNGFAWVLCVGPITIDGLSNVGPKINGTINKKRRLPVVYLGWFVKG